MQVAHCRICRSTDLNLIVDLGRTALANSFVRDAGKFAGEEKFPLRLVICGDCGLVQIDEEVSPEVLFKDYIYVSGTSDLIHRHAAMLADWIIPAYDLSPADLVLEAASNDGTVLRAFQRRGLKTVGIEPASNIAARANQDGVETICEFFGAATAADVRGKYGPAKLILARHVLAHVAELHGFVQGLHDVLAHDGVAAVEMPHLLPFYENVEFDTVYHEHLCYFSVTVLKSLFAQHGLEVIDVREVAIHGGSIVVVAQRSGGPHAVTPAVSRLIAIENRMRLSTPGTWARFADRVKNVKTTLLRELDSIQAAGGTCIGYGAPAKGMTLLAYCGIGPENLPYLVDRSPHKQGKYTPGHHIPVHGVERLLEDQPDVALILAWNFAAEIVKQQDTYSQRGGRFLLPLPVAKYWSADRASALQKCVA